MNNIREIYTKAIVAKGKKLSKNSYTFSMNDYPNEILGCWITNHHFDASIKQGVPKIVGTFDVHLWYSFNDNRDSKTEKRQVTYIDEMQVIKKENRDFEVDDLLKARCLSKPKCLSSYVKEKNIICEVEKEMQIEISGETCIKVEVKDEDEVWDDFDDIQVNPDFLK